MKFTKVYAVVVLLLMATFDLSLAQTNSNLLLGLGAGILGYSVGRGLFGGNRGFIGGYPGGYFGGYPYPYPSYGYPAYPRYPFFG